MKNLKGILITIAFLVISLLQTQAQNSTTIPGSEVGDQTHIFKVNASAAAFKILALSYERLKSPNRICESTVKITHLGSANDDFGFGYDYGVKFKRGAIQNHIMASTYVKPVIGVHAIIEDKNDSALFLNTGINVGKQWIVNNKIAIDAFVGYHFVLGNKKTVYVFEGGSYERPDRIVNAGDLYVNGNHAFSFGVKIGLLYGSRRK